jgi:hypothetical protein
MYKGKRGNMQAKNKGKDCGLGLGKEGERSKDKGKVVD